MAKQTHTNIGFISLGCPKALVDSERILTQLKIEGYNLSDSYEDADLVIVNTCGFIDEAKAESIEAIGEALNENGKVIVTGCLGANEQSIREIHPQVLDVSGPQAYERVLSSVKLHLPIDKEHKPFEDIVPPQGIKLTPKHYAYLKISEGCNQSCSFCIIPSMRGKLVSRPIGDVMDEAERLVDAGVKELLIVSQDTGAYGVDTKYRTGFWQGRPIKTKLYDLASTLGELGIWIRMHYLYPYPHISEIIPLMQEGKILPYLDVPFQHASPRILKDMRRPANIENNLDQIAQWRATCPDLAIRSSFIVGFPGETESDFQLLLDFIQEAQLEHAGCFQYSAVEGAKANELHDLVDHSIVQDRFERFMEAQAEICKQKLKRKIGKQYDVIIDTIEDDEIIGRTKYDAPEIDGLIYINQNHPKHNTKNIQKGDIIKVTVTGSDEYDLVGEPSN